MLPNMTWRRESVKPLTGIKRRMALDLFKRVETRKGLFAVEKITLIYNLLTSILILFLFQRMDHPWHMLLDRAMIAAMTFLLMYLYRLAPCKFSAFVRVAIQMSLLSYWYPDTFEFNRFFPNLDHVFAITEQFIFNGQPAIWFCHTFPHLLVSEAFNMGYFFYYPMMLIVALFYFIYKFEWFERCLLCLSLSFFIYYLIYIFVPVAGPQFYFPAIGIDNVSKGIFPAIGDYFNYNQELLPGPGYQHGFFYSLVEGSQQVGERPTAAFPSSHVGISTILMIMAWRGSKKLFACLIPFYMLLCGATVYIQAHYVIDAIVGFFSAFLLYVVVTWMFKKWFAQPMFKVKLILKRIYFFRNCFEYPEQFFFRFCPQHGNTSLFKIRNPFEQRTGSQVAAHVQDAPAFIKQIHTVNHFLAKYLHTPFKAEWRQFLPCFQIMLYFLEYPGTSEAGTTDHDGIYSVAVKHSLQRWGVVTSPLPMIRNVHPLIVLYFSDQCPVCFSGVHLRTGSTVNGQCGNAAIL